MFKHIFSVIFVLAFAIVSISSAQAATTFEASRLEFPSYPTAYDFYIQNLQYPELPDENGDGYPDVDINNHYFGAYTLLSHNGDMYAGFGSSDPADTQGTGTPHAADGSQIVRLSLDEQDALTVIPLYTTTLDGTAVPERSLDDQGVNSLVANSDGTITVGGVDPHTPDGWDSGNSYSINPDTNEIDKYRYSSGMENIIHTWSINSSEGTTTIAAAGGQSTGERTRMRAANLLLSTSVGSTAPSTSSFPRLRPGYEKVYLTTRFNNEDTAITLDELKNSDSVDIQFQIQTLNTSDTHTMTFDSIEIRLGTLENGSYTTHYLSDADISQSCADGEVSIDHIENLLNGNTPRPVFTTNTAGYSCTIQIDNLDISQLSLENSEGVYILALVTPYTVVNDQPIVSTCGPIKSSFCGIVYTTTDNGATWQDQYYHDTYVYSAKEWLDNTYVITYLPDQFAAYSLLKKTDGDNQTWDVSIPEDLAAFQITELEDQIIMVSKDRNKLHVIDGEGTFHEYSLPFTIGANGNQEEPTAAHKFQNTHIITYMSGYYYASSNVGTVHRSADLTSWEQIIDLNTEEGDNHDILTLEAWPEHDLIILSTRGTGLDSTEEGGLWKISITEEPDPISIRHMLRERLVGFDYDPADNSYYSLGVLTVDFRMRNRSGMTFKDVHFITNHVLNAGLIDSTTPEEIGSIMTLSNEDLGEDGVWTHGEAIVVPFRVGIHQAPWGINFDTFATPVE